MITWAVGDVSSLDIHPQRNSLMSCSACMYEREGSRFRLEELAGEPCSQ